MEKHKNSLLGQQWRVNDYESHACYVPALGQGVVDLLKPSQKECILDLGCGDGALTVKIIESGATVIGLEPDSELAEAARQKGIEIWQCDAHNLSEIEIFDAVFSNAAMHWMRDPQHVLNNVARCLKPGGRFVAEQGGFGNVAAICTAILAALKQFEIAVPDPFPWDFPTLHQQKSRLIKAGFDVDDIQLFSRPTRLPTGIEGWLTTFIGPFVKSCDVQMRQKIIRYAVSLLEPTLMDHEGYWTADYVRLRFIAVKTA